MISRTNGSSIRKKKEGKEKELRNNSNIDLYIGVQLLIINETTGGGRGKAIITPSIGYVPLAKMLNTRLSTIDSFYWYLNRSAIVGASVVYGA